MSVPRADDEPEVAKPAVPAPSPSPESEAADHVVPASQSEHGAEVSDAAQADSPSGQDHGDTVSAVASDGRSDDHPSGADEAPGTDARETTPAAEHIPQPSPSSDSHPHSR